MPARRVPQSTKRFHRVLRQARYRAKPEVRIRKRASNRAYYERHKDRLRAAAKARAALLPDPATAKELRARFRVITPASTLPEDSSLTTRNSFGRRTLRTEFIVEGRWPTTADPWDFVTASPDLSTALGIGGKGYNRDLKEFIRIELLRLFPERYRSRADLPTEDDAHNRRGPDAREAERRIIRTQLAAQTPDFACAECDYYGPMIPRPQGPFPAAHLSEDTQALLDAAPDDMLPAAFCPKCRVMLSFRVGTDLSPPLGFGDADDYRCVCGFRGRPSVDLASSEFVCPQCQLVVGETIDDRAPRSLSDE